MRVIASFDDACKEDLILSDLMQTYHIPTIFYFPAMPLNIKGRQDLTLDERQIIATKHEIGSHTVTHPLLTRISEGYAMAEIFDSRKELQKEFAQEITAFCYPRGYSNPELQILVKEAGYTHARGVTVGYLEQSENPYYEQTTVHVGCNRKEYAGLSWDQYAKEMIQQANDNSVFHLWGHGWEIAQDVHNFDLLDKLCYQLTKGK